MSKHEDAGRPDTAAAPVPPLVGRAEFEEALVALRAREKEHTRAGDAIAAARRRLPMVEVDAATELIGPDGPATLLDAFEGRRQLIAYFHMWHRAGAASEQCEGCTFFNGQVSELASLHRRGITYAVLCQGPYEESVRYRGFMGWTMPWYSAEPSLDTLLTGRAIGKFHLVCYLQEGGRVFETYWTNGRGVETLDNIFALMDLTPYGRQETWEESPNGWPQGSIMSNLRAGGRPIAQWERLEAARSDNLGGKGT